MTVPPSDVDGTALPGPPLSGSTTATALAPPDEDTAASGGAHRPPRPLLPPPPTAHRLPAPAHPVPGHPPAPAAPATAPPPPPPATAPALPPPPQDLPSTVPAGTATGTPLPAPGVPEVAPAPAPGGPRPPATPDPLPAASDEARPPDRTSRRGGSRRGGSRRGLRRVLVGMVLVAGVAAAAWFGYRAVAGDEPAPGETPEASADGLDGDGATSIIDETQQLVDEINSVPGVGEALAELGLDETGAPSATAEPPADPDASPIAADPAAVASYAFRWSDPFGLQVTVQVDSASGDFLATTSDGTEIRHVDGRYFGLADNSSWVELSPEVVEEIPVIGTDGVLADDALLPAGLDRFVVASEVGENGTMRLLIDDAELARSDPDLRRTWLAPWGLLDAEAPVADAAPTEGAVPASAEDGQIVVELVQSEAGWLSEVTLSSPAIGGTATYELASTAIYPLPVEIPEPLAGG